MLLIGMICGALTIGPLRFRTIVLIVLAGSGAWGSLVGASASSSSVALGGAALAAANIAVGFVFMLAIGWPVHRRRAIG